jgi:sialidase-1
MEFQVLATRGQGGYRQYRIPSLAATKTGRLIAIYDGRPDLDDLPGPVDLVIRISDDSGSTWSAQEIFLSGEGITGYGDASIIIDPSVGELGRVIVLSQKSELASFFESNLGTDLDDPNIVHICRSISDDDGKTWKHEVITHQVKDAITPGIFASSGTGHRISFGPYAGRLLHTFVLRRGDELSGAIGFSDDHGITWQLGAEIPGGNESAIISLDDGSLLIHSRSRPNRLTARSHDGGLTLSSLLPDLALPDPSDNGSLSLLANGDVICTHNHDSDLRRRTVVKRSHDGGVTWPESALLEVGSSAYSTSCELADGNIGVLFERGGYTEIVFARVTSTDFSNTSYLLNTESDENGIEFSVTLRFVLPARADQDAVSTGTEIKKVPAVDMTVWDSHVKKEVGKAGGSTGGETIFNRRELDLLLGPVSVGLHLGDELRFSGRLANLSGEPISNVEVSNTCDNSLINAAIINPGGKLLFMDVRQIISEKEVAAGFAKVRFGWHGLKTDASKISGELIQYISTTTGLLVN